MSPESEALLCAKASLWMYGTETDPDGLQYCKQRMRKEGFEDFLWLDLETNYRRVCAFIATCEQYHILAFRGTKFPQDWITNLNCISLPFEEVFTGMPALGQIHAGFGACLEPGLPKLIRMLQSRDTAKPLLITGHSLGGALACLAAVYFSAKRPAIVTVRRVFTFGQPRVGVQKLCESFRHFVRAKLVRFVNDEDLVPRIPLRCQGFADGGTVIHFSSAGIPHLDSVEWENYLKTPFQAFQEVLQKLTLQVCLADHEMLRYLQLMRTTQAQLTPLLVSVCDDRP